MTEEEREGFGVGGIYSEMNQGKEDTEMPEFIK